MEDKERQQGRCWWADITREITRGITRGITGGITRGTECVGCLDHVVDNVGVKMSRKYFYLFFTERSVVFLPVR